MTVCSAVHINRDCICTLDIPLFLSQHALLQGEASDQPPSGDTTTTVLKGGSLVGAWGHQQSEITLIQFQHLGFAKPPK